MRTVITGITGFVGSHLAEYLLSLENVEVFAFYRWRSRMDNLKDLTQVGKVNIIGENSSVTSADQLSSMIDKQSRKGAANLIEGDMLDPYSMQRFIGAVKPDRIFHLAAQSYVPGSQNAPTATLMTNILGELNIFEAVRQANISPLIHIAGSSEEYGLVHPHETPIKEENPLRPLSQYGVSKVTQEMLAYQYFMSFGLKTVVTRGFNHTGPRRGQVFVTSNFSRQIAEAEKGLRPPVIYTGDPNSMRDFTDVRDMVKAYWMALEKGEPGEAYNVGTGKAISIKELGDILASLAKIKVEFKVDQTRLRPSDVTLLVADTSKFKKRTGWEPTIPFKKTAEDLLNYWRERV